MNASEELVAGMPFHGVSNYRHKWPLWITLPLPEDGVSLSQCGYAGQLQGIWGPRMFTGDEQTQVRLRREVLKLLDTLKVKKVQFAVPEAGNNKRRPAAPHGEGSVPQRVLRRRANHTSMAESPLKLATAVDIQKVQTAWRAATKDHSRCCKTWQKTWQQKEVPRIQASKLGDILPAPLVSKMVEVVAHQIPSYFRPSASSIAQMQLDFHMPGTGDLTFIQDGFVKGDKMISAESMAEIKAEALMANLLFQGEVVASAAIRLIRMENQQIKMAFRPIVVDEHWQNLGIAKLLVKHTWSVISNACKVASVGILVKATQRSWPMWRGLGAAIEEEAIRLAHAWQNQEGCTSFSGLTDGCVDAIIHEAPSGVGAIIHESPSSKKRSRASSKHDELSGVAQVVPLTWPEDQQPKLHSSTERGECMPYAASQLLQPEDASSSSATRRAWLLGLAGGGATLQIYNEAGAYMPLALLDAALRKARRACFILMMDSSVIHAREMGPGPQLCRVHLIGYHEGQATSSPNGCFVYDSERWHLSSLTWQDETTAEASIRSLVGADASDSLSDVLRRAPPLSSAELAQLAGGDSQNQEATHVPTFCCSITGDCNADGQPHGYCVGRFQLSDVQLSGEWVNGMPCGQVCLSSPQSALDVPGGTGTTVELDTEPPSSLQYHEAPGLLAPGYLWPRPSLEHNGKRVVTVSIYDDGSLAGQRTYEVRVCTGGIQGIAMQCIDQQCGRVGKGLLPPRVARGTFQDAHFRGTEALITLQQADTFNDSITWIGYIQGTSSAPFARSGTGRLLTPYKSKLAVMEGVWWGDRYVYAPHNHLTTLEAPAMVLLRNATECHTCLAVTDANHLHRCRVQSVFKHLHSARNRPAPSGTSGISVHIVGYDGCVIGAFVKQNVSFQTGEVQRGAAGSFCYVEVNEPDPESSKCFAAKCCDTLSCRRIKLCPHLQLAVKHISHMRSSDAGLVIGAGGRSLNGFMALTGVEDPASLPPRICHAPQCRVAISEGAEGTHSASRGKTVPGKTADEEGVEGEGEEGEEGEESEEGQDGDSDGQSDSGATQSAAGATAYGYIPTLQELLGMKVARLRGLASVNGIDSIGNRAALRYLMVEHFHPQDVGQVPATYRAAAEAASTGSQKESSRPSKRKLGGARRRKSGDPGLQMAIEHFRSEYRARRCVAGSMCREFAHQKTLAVDFLHCLINGGKKGGGGEGGGESGGGDVGGNRGGGEGGGGKGGSGEGVCTECEDDDWCGGDERCSCDAPALPPAKRQASRTRLERELAQLSFGAPGMKALVDERDTAASDEDAELWRLEGGGPGPGPGGVGRGGATSATEEGATDSSPDAQYTQLPLNPLQVDEFLHSIQLAKQRRTSVVVPLGPNFYSVIRRSYEDCSYSTPGGYSQVSARMVSSPSSQGTVLEMHCNCSEFRSSRSGLGGKSRTGSAKTCTCCYIVIMANALRASPEDIRGGKSVWLLAVQGDCSVPAHAENSAKSEQEEMVEALLAGKRFPEEWDSRTRVAWQQATRHLENKYGDGTYTSGMERPQTTLFPWVICPLPMQEPACPTCINANGCPMTLKRRRISGARPTAWVFIGTLVLRQPMDTYTCVAELHSPSTRRVIHPMSVDWTTATGLFNVANAWFFSVLLLEAVTKTIRTQKKIAPLNACHRVLLDTWETMRDIYADAAVLPDWDLACQKMYNGWYCYEMVLKEVDRAAYSICNYCGLLPPKTGSDACAKVALNLQKESSRLQLDYSPQPDKELWTRSRFFGVTHRNLVNKIMWGNCRRAEAIPVDLVPPIFFNDDYASDTVYNTEAVKRGAVAKAVGSGSAPTTQSLLPLSIEVSSGNLDISKLRSPETNLDVGWLDEMMRRCDCTEKEQAKANTKAKKVGWLLDAWDSLVAGTSDCHMHYQVARGTGGSCTLSCPHGVVIVYKFLFSAETNRDHCDVLRSLIIPPCVHWLDDACGLMTHWQGTHVEEFKKLYGENRGCPKKWLKDPPKSYLTPVSIPELEKDAHKSAAQHPETRRYAESILAAKGSMRLERHPFMTEHFSSRLTLTDRMHAELLHKKTHKRKSCSLYLASMVSSLTHDRTTIMESLNARLKEHLTTICTAGPDHAIPFLDRIVYWENRAIIEKQRKALHDACPPGMKVVQDNIFKFALYACASCGKNEWEECMCTKEPAAAREKSAPAPYDEEELHARVKELLRHIVGNAEVCSFEKLYDAMVRADVRVAASGRDALEGALVAMEERNEVMFREGAVHVI